MLIHIDFVLWTCLQCSVNKNKQNSCTTALIVYVILCLSNDLISVFIICSWEEMGKLKLKSNSRSTNVTHTTKSGISVVEENSEDWTGLSLSEESEERITLDI